MTNAAVLSILVKAQGIAETSRQLRTVHGDLGKASRTARSAGDDLEKTGKRGSTAMRGLKLATGALAGVAVFETLKKGVGAAVGEFQEARKVGALTTQVIKTTGGAANVTARDITNLTGALSKKVGIDDEAIQSGANLLLTFKNIRNETGRGRDIFNQATAAAVDLSAAGFGSLSSTSKQLGKALNDPVKGMTALGRAGVTFSEDQKKAIEALMATGKASDRVKAQQIILREVQSQVGGAAAAQATSMDKAKVAFGNLAEAAGAVLVPAFDKVARFLATFINQMIEGRSVGGALVSTFKGIGSAIGGLIGAVSSIVGWFRQHETVALALAAAAGTVATAMVALRVAAIVQMIPGLVASASAWLALNAAMLLNPAVLIVAGLAALAAAIVVAYRESETFRNIVDAAFTAVKAAAAVMWDVLKVVFDGIVATIRVAWDVVDTVTRAVWGAIGGFLEAFWAVLLTVVTAYFNAYKTVITTVWNVIRTVTEAVWGAIKTILTAVWTAIAALITTYFDAYKAIVTAAWNAIKTVTETVWGAIKTIATGAWGFLEAAATTAWGLIKAAILSPIRDARDALAGIWGEIKERAGDAWDALKTSAGTFATGLKDAIVDAFKSAVNSVVGFVNKIIDVVNAIPGVPNIGHVKGFAQGGANSADAFARGGAYARTGGLVRKPLVMMGEEAPRHPEYVIPTNPAYRGRAVGLLSQAAGKLGVPGFAEGGILSKSELVALAQRVNMPDPNLMAAIALAESAGKTDAFGPPSGKGLWQIEWNVWGKRFASLNPFDAYENALMAHTVLQEQGLNAWVAYTNGHYKQFLGAQDHLSFNPLDLLKSLLGKLPNPADMLPDWLQGLGGYAIDKVTGWIKKQVTGVLGGSVPGWGQLDRFAAQLGLGITSTYRPGDDGYHGMLMGLGGRAHATDYSNSTGPTAQMLTFAREVGTKFGSQLKELIYKPLGWGVKNGQRVGLDFPFPWDEHLNHVHVAFQKGGIFDAPFVGSYATGGVVPRDGFGYLHGGETVTPAGRGDGPLVHIEHMEIRHDQDVEKVAARLAWRITAGAPA